MTRLNVSLERHERGIALIATAASLIAIVGIAGVSVDLGRMYIAKSELMAYTDAASVAAALQLDGTAAGITRAQNAAAGMASGANAMGWDFATKPVAGATLQFAMGFVNTPNAPDPATWSANPPDASDYRFVKVTASANVPLTFMQAFQLFQTGSSTGLSAVAASSVAAQALVTNFPQGLLPFSPIAPSNVPDNFGMTPGIQYTIRYPSGGGLKKSDVCAGDQNQTYWNSLPSQDRGFWGSTSAAALRGEIVDTTQTAPINIGDPVPMVGGNKNTEGTALDARVNEDSDPNSATYADYMALGKGNGRRVIGVPVNSGPPSFDAIGIAEFFLLPTPTYLAITGTKAICAEYVGPYVEGSSHPGAGATAKPRQHGRLRGQVDSVKLARKQSGERGDALIEFALSFFLIFAVFAGIFQFAYSFYVYNTLVTAVREGARYASLKPYDSTTTTPSANFLTAVQNMVVYRDANPPNGTAPVVAGLNLNNVALTVTGGPTGGTLNAPTQMTVSITGFTVDAVFRTWNLTGKPNCTFPYTGILTPP